MFTYKSIGLKGKKYLLKRMSRSSCGNYRNRSSAIAPRHRVGLGPKYKRTNNISCFQLRPASGHKNHLTCNPSWYWTAACMASSNLSTRSFQALFRESQAEFNYKTNCNSLSVRCMILTIRNKQVGQVSIEKETLMKVENTSPVPHLYFSWQWAYQGPHMQRWAQSPVWWPCRAPLAVHRFPLLLPRIQNWASEHHVKPHQNQEKTPHRASGPQGSLGEISTALFHFPSSYSHFLNKSKQKKYFMENNIL